jgi:hypothetical protein
MNKTILLSGFVFMMLLFGCLGPSPPGDVSAKAVKGGIEVSWSASQSADVSGYNVYGSTESGSLGSKINPALLTGTDYTDKSVTDGQTYYYTVRAVTTGGSEDQSMKQASATADTKPPSDQSISINKDAPYTNNTNVVLTVSANGAKECRFSNSNWMGWMDYSGTYNWELESGDGEKTVSMECRDGVGNTAEPVSTSIELDTSLPEVTITTPESGKTYSESLDVKFQVTDKNANTVECRGFLDSEKFDIGIAQTGASHTTHLHPEEGQHTIRIECSDKVNTGSSSTVSFHVTKKLPATIHIESGSGYVDNTQVTLDTSSKGATLCRFSNNNVEWSGWRSYVSTQSWSLTSGDGTKTVYMQCKDESGTMSVTASDSVVLDTSPPPYISVSINNGDQVTNKRQVTLGLYAFGARECRFSNEDLAWSSYEPYASSKSWTLTQGNGLKTIHYHCIDRNKNSVGTAVSSITLNQIPPQAPDVSLTINKGDDHTGKRKVSLRIDSLYANKCRLRNSDQGWESWFTHTGEKIDWVLRPGHGRRTVYVECQNDYGTGHDHASIYVDEEKPGSPRDLRGSYSDSSIRLNWRRPSEHYSDIMDYAIYRKVEGHGGYSKYHFTGGTSYVDHDVKGGLVYDYYIRARDNSGNLGDESNHISVSVDASKPHVQITSPSHGSSVMSLFEVDFTVIDTQYDSVSCRYYIDGSAKGGWSTYYTGSSNTLRAGTDDPDQKTKHKLKVVCKDGHGNKGSNEVSFFVEPSHGRLLGGEDS